MMKLDGYINRFIDQEADMTAVNITISLTCYDDP